MYEPVGPIAGRPGFFQGFKTLTDEGARQELLERFAEVCVKRDRTECERCKGRGYTKEDGRIGCSSCHGLGAHE